MIPIWVRIYVIVSQLDHLYLKRSSVIAFFVQLLNGIKTNSLTLVYVFYLKKKEIRPQIENKYSTCQINRLHSLLKIDF